MASIKSFKKEINNTIGGLIEEIYLWELTNPSADLTASEAIIDEAIELFDELIQQINATSKEERNQRFVEIRSAFQSGAQAIETKINQLG
ncbi:MAG: hypothetical protein ACPGC5_04860 [Flavobacteriaceae bacterium]